jgi:hypothetical protein
LVIESFEFAPELPVTVRRVPSLRPAPFNVTLFALVMPVFPLVPLLKRSVVWLPPLVFA